MAASLIIVVVGFSRLKAQAGEASQTRQILKRMDTSVRDAVMGANDFVSTQEEDDRALSVRAFPAVAAGLNALRDVLPELGVEVERALDLVAAAEHKAALIFAGSTLAERIAFMRDFDRDTANLAEAMEQLDARAQDSTETALLRTCYAILGSWGTLWVIAIGMWIVARRRLVHEVQSEKLTTAAGVSLLAGSVRHQECVPKGSESALGPAFKELLAAVDHNGHAVAGLREVLRRERERSSFQYHFAEALDLADTEDEICATVKRATGIAFADQRVQVLLADNSQALLEPRTEGGPTACSPGTPFGCPAIRWSRTMEALPDGGMARCPKLTDATCTVTCACVSVHGQAVGVLQTVGKRLEDGAKETLSSMAIATGGRLGVVRTLGERELQASTDVLTGLSNRRAMNQRLAALDKSGARYSVIAADLDHFKRLNDSFGHEMGDRCLRIFAQALRDSCRAGDVPARPGGEEFLVILPGTELDEGQAVAERIRSHLAEASRKAGVSFTVSLGVAARAGSGSGSEQVLRAADGALYQAKAEGRDRVVVAGRPAPLSVVPKATDHDHSPVDAALGASSASKAH